MTDEVGNVELLLGSFKVNILSTKVRSEDNHLTQETFVVENRRRGIEILNRIIHDLLRK